MVSLKEGDCDYQEEEETDDDVVQETGLSADEASLHCLGGSYKRRESGRNDKLMPVGRQERGNSNPLMRRRNNCTSRLAYSLHAQTLRQRCASRPQRTGYVLFERLFVGLCRLVSFQLYFVTLFCLSSPIDLVNGTCAQILFILLYIQRVAIQLLSLMKSYNRLTMKLQQSVKQPTIYHEKKVRQA